MNISQLTRQTTNQRQTNDNKQEAKEEKNIYTSNEILIFSYFGDLKEDNQKVIDIGIEFDIRPKDVLFCVRDMLSKSSDKGVEIKNVKSKLNTWINNAIRWHNVATLTAKAETETKKNPVKRYKSGDDYLLQEFGIKMLDPNDPKYKVKEKEL